MHTEPPSASEWKRPELTFTLCVRDDDARVFEFRKTNDNGSVMNLVTSAVRRGRNVRAYLLATGPGGPTREQRYLARRGYSEVPVKL